MIHRMADTDYYRSRIQRALEFIDERLGEPMTAAQVAEAAHFSEYHFHRLFPAFTGEPIHHYVRSRRLEKAAIQLRENPETVLTELALDVGFETPSAFARAFKQHFGISPSGFRSGQLPLHDSPARAQANRPYLKTKAVATLNLSFTVENTNAMVLQYRSAKGTSHGRFFAEKNLTELFAGLISDQPTAVVSAYPASPAGLNDSEVEVWYGGLFSQPDLGSWSKQRHQFVAGQWAVFDYRGSYNYLHQAWNQVYCVWLPNSGYALRDELPFETYLNSPVEVVTADLHTQIWLPISGEEQA